jgi:hypothetical protein
MFCSNCHRPVHYKDLKSKGWCENCRRVIDVTSCRVSYWCILAVMMMPWLI